MAKFCGVCVACPNCGGSDLKTRSGKRYKCLSCKCRFNLSSRKHVKVKTEGNAYDIRRAKAKVRAKRKFLDKQAAIMRNSPTLAEVVFQKKLEKAKFNFKPQWVYDIEGFAGIVDFYLYDYKLLIEIDGGYHLDDEQQLKDAEKDFVCGKLLKKRLVRLTNDEAFAITDEGVLALLV